MDAIKVVILCGGQGSRIRDVAADVPKPMVKIGDRPILWHIMALYAHYGIRDFVLCLGYRGWVIKEYFINYHAFVSDITVSLGDTSSLVYHDAHPQQDWRVTLAETGETSQTGHRIWRVRKYLEKCELFCVTYGDGVADIDLANLVAFHRNHGRVATITGVRPPGRFGVLGVDPQGDVPIVDEFQEKPQSAEGLINGGFFVFDHRLWNYVDSRTDEVFEHAPLQRLAADRQLVMYKHEGFWQPMDTYREWLLLNDLWAGGKAPWKR